ncbi:MAG: thioredoxin domain-containing protein [Gemmatimonadales bacterium]|nr:thioredoxin domain-containing protein [Gemmatimonadales bacterium]
MQLRWTIALGAFAIAACSGPPSGAQSAATTVRSGTPAAPAATATPRDSGKPRDAAAGSDTLRAVPLELRAKGAANAPVTVYEMSDFQCPFCRRYAMETFPTIEREYVATGKVRWIFINFPLTQIHPNAAAAAAFALCAARAGKFWPVHDLLYRHQETWAPLKDPGAFLLSLADSVALPRPGMLTCLRSPAAREAVQADAGGAAQSGASSTPTFYIEGGMMSGALPVDVFRHVLDSIYVVRTARK